MEEYLEKLLSQIRCKKARPYISDEMRKHMEDQITDNIAHGMTAEEAERNAVADMGDPVEAGISLDKVHKPQVAWKLIVIVGILSLLGIFIQQSISYHIAEISSDIPQYYALSGTGFVTSVILGFVVMCAIYFLDYTTIAKYSKFIGAFIICMGILCISGIFGTDMNGRRYWGFGPVRLSATTFMMFYVPIYGAILYKYRGGGVASLLKALVWLLIPVIITFRIPNLVVTTILMVSMLIQLSTAVIKGWFKIPIKRTLVILCAVLVILPMILLLFMYTFHLLAAYQEARIRAWLFATGDASYLSNILRSLCTDIAFIGNSGKDVMGTIPDCNSDYIFSYILNSYGSIAGTLIIAALAVLIISIFSVSVKQKNEIGLVMGFGCGMIILLSTVINILSTVGVIPPAASFLPFLSAGRSNILLCYALVGIIMSIYRYKDVYPKNVKVPGKTFQMKFTIGL
ncbi:MAG: FtsW/RodA/SpoVE family cell cycle protein [Lachnospiraceae bacterium]|nr:FtsW/RodA/SpoVE family cell cycle protein [Lachnospiraceae bacterium]